MISNDLPAHLQELNPPQLEAVRHFEGPILILAGAGSGKTRVLTRRVANLVLTHRVHPRNILAITFTNKAAGEMRARLERLLGPRAGDLWVSTFHSAGLRILRRHADRLGYKNSFVVYDEQDARSLVKSIIKDANIDEKKYPPGLFLRAIDRAKNNLILPEECGPANTHRGYEGRLEHEVYARYQQALFRANAMDFGDLLVNAALLFRRCPEVLEIYRHYLRFILVDEFQDTNQVQYALVRALAAPRGNLFVVGDDDQSIYTFRGATVRNLLEFERDYPGAKVVKLEQNYRSTGNILEVSHAVIEKNKERKPKKLWTAAAQGAPILTFAGWDEGEEASFIAREIKEQASAGRRLAEMAVFYRTNAQSRALEEALMDAALPYRIYGGLKFYERKEIKDVLAYLRLLLNRDDDQSFLRALNTPPRGIGAQTAARLRRLAAEQGLSLWAAALTLREKSRPLAGFMTLIEELAALAADENLGELIGATAVKSGYEERLQESKDITALSRLENLRELQVIGYGMAGAGDTPAESLSSFLDRVSLTSGDELPKEDAAQGPQEKPDVVSLMTLHLAKGLEFPVVFLTGVEEGLLPHYRALLGEESIDEERRLCYVGMTRAKERLYVTRARMRGLFSAGGGFGASSRYREPSRFMYDVPQTCLEGLGSDFFGWEAPLDDDCAQADESDVFDEAEEGLGRRRALGSRKRRKRTFDAGAWIKRADELE